MTKHINLLQGIARPQPFVGKLASQAHYAVEEVCQVGKWLNRKVLLLTKVLPRSCALFTYQLWLSAPYIAMGFLLPTPLYIAGIICAVAFNILTSPFSRDGIASVEIGVGFAELAIGTVDIIYGGLTKSIFSVVAGGLEIALGGFLLFQGDLIRKITKAAKRTIPQE
jgi:hypothetical protein